MRWGALHGFALDCIELAGEIKSTWPYMHVILFDAAADVLGDDYREDLRAELRAQLDIGTKPLGEQALDVGEPEVSDDA